MLQVIKYLSNDLKTFCVGHKIYEKCYKIFICTRLFVKGKNSVSNIKGK